MRRTKEECVWCMTTQRVKRQISPKMPKEYEYRCSACHEQWAEDHYECDNCHALIDIDVLPLVRDESIDSYFCSEFCKSLYKTPCP